MAMAHPVGPVHLQHIGDMAVSFALLEDQLQFLARTLLGLDQQTGQIVTSELSFRGLRATVSSLYRQRFGEDSRLAELKSILSEAASIEERRNILTHSIWGAGPDADTITRFKVTAKESKGLTHGFEFVTATDLSNFASRIRDLAERVQTFTFNLMNGS